MSLILSQKVQQVPVFCLKARFIAWRFACFHFVLSCIKQSSRITSGAMRLRPNIQKNNSESIL